jgi:hypothetical protein
MPSYNFIRMRDADLADIVVYLRTVPVVQKDIVSGVAAVVDSAGYGPG